MRLYLTIHLLTTIQDGEARAEGGRRKTLISQILDGTTTTSSMLKKVVLKYFYPRRHWEFTKMNVNLGTVFLMKKKWTTIFEEVYKLKLRLNLEADFAEFSRFYDFVFFVLRENGQKNITIIKAVTGWKIVLAGRFRLLDHWCDFVEKNQRYNISEDTWQQVLAFSRSVHENLEGYDREGAWPVLIDDFVEHMYRIGGVDTISNSFCSCGDSGAQPFEDSFPGLKNFPGLKRKCCGNLQRIEESSHGHPGMDVIVNSKRRHINLGNQNVHRTENQSHGYLEMVKANSPLNHSASPCTVEGCLSKGFEGLLSGPSCLQFDKERRTSYT